MCSPVAIHASKTYDHAGHKYIEDILGITVPENLPSGGLLGMAEITDCVTESSSQWFTGPYGFTLAVPETLPFIKYRGMQKMFDVDIGNLGEDRVVSQ